MPRIGLVYEDEPIRIVAETLIPRILDLPTEFRALLGGSWPGFIGALPGLLRVLDNEHHATPFEGVLVIVDADRSAPQEREERLRGKIGNRIYTFGTPVYYGIKRQVETLLLGDPAAINVAAGREIPAVRDPESLQDAKRHLIQQLRNQNAPPYDREFVRTTINAANLETLEVNCPRFSLLKRALQEMLPRLGGATPEA